MGECEVQQSPSWRVRGNPDLHQRCCDCGAVDGATVVGLRESTIVVTGVHCIRGECACECATRLPPPCGAVPVKVCQHTVLVAVRVGVAKGIHGEGRPRHLLEPRHRPRGGHAHERAAAATPCRLAPTRYRWLLLLLTSSLHQHAHGTPLGASGLRWGSLGSLHKAGGCCSRPLELWLVVLCCLLV